MKIDILTLFPEMYEGFLKTSIIGRAINEKLVEIEVHNIRDFSLNKHKKVDDYAYGGGDGMVLMPEPIKRAIDYYKKEDSLVILLTPQGETLNQNISKKLKLERHLILVCGHYEGFDERIRSFVDYEISIGDYVLTGGELASMVLTDSVVRLLDGVITKGSYENDTFEDNLLDYPVYTHPFDFEGMKVPDVLISGNHEEIRKWRLEEQIKRTKERRPDLLEKR